MNFVPYTTREGDRLDTIATRAFGNPFLWKPFIEANPSLPLLDSYPSGIKIQIPVQEIPGSTVDKNLLPPWKR